MAILQSSNAAGMHFTQTRLTSENDLFRDMLF